jgi:hypothetical protein
MTEILLRCRDYYADGETIKITCELDSRRHIKFDEGPHDGVATEQGEEYKIVLDDNGTIDFGREYEGDRYWRADLHQLAMQVGAQIKVRAGGDPWTYEIVQIL